jgi:hypothetical protein
MRIAASYPSAPACPRAAPGAPGSDSSIRPPARARLATTRAWTPGGGGGGRAPPPPPPPDLMVSLRELELRKDNGAAQEDGEVPTELPGMEYDVVRREGHRRHHARQLLEQPARGRWRDR